MHRLKEETSQALTTIEAVTRLSAAPETLEVDQLLRLVHEFGSASLELLAWEQFASERWVRPSWDAALRERLLEFVQVDRINGEAMYMLTHRGRSRIGERLLSVTK